MEYGLTGRSEIFISDHLQIFKELFMLIKFSNGSQLVTVAYPLIYADPRINFLRS